MRILAVVHIAIGMLVATAAQAQPSRSDLAGACQQEARRKGLGGEALTQFMKQCSAGQVSTPPRPVAANPLDSSKYAHPDAPKHSRPSRDDGRWYLQRPTSY